MEANDSFNASRSYWTLYQLIRSAAKEEKTANPNFHIKISDILTGLSDFDKDKPFMLTRNNIKKVVNSLPSRCKPIADHLLDNKETSLKIKNINSQWEKIHENGLIPISALDPQLTDLFRLIPQQVLYTNSSTQKILDTLSSNQEIKIEEAATDIGNDDKQVKISPYFIHAKNSIQATNIHSWVHQRQLAINKFQNTYKYDSREKSQKENTIFKKNSNQQYFYKDVLNELSPFLSDNDVSLLQNSLDKKAVWPIKNIDRAKEVLTFLYDNGLGFNININEKYHNQISAKITDGKNVNVRILDRNPLYIGQTYNGSGSFYYLNERKSELPSAIAAVAVAMGLDDSAKIRQTANGSYIKTSNSRQKLYFKPNRRNIDLSDPSVGLEKSKKDVENMIQIARKHYIKELVGEDLTGFDESLADDQKVFQKMLEESNATKADVLKITSLLFDTIGDQSVDEQRKFILSNAAFLESLDDAPDKLKATKSWLDSNHISSETFVKVIKDSKNQDLRDIYPSSFQKKLLVLPSDEIDVNKLDNVQQNIYQQLSDLADKAIGTYEQGFNPSKVMNFTNIETRHDCIDKLLADLKRLNYDTNKFIGNNFSNDMMKDKLVTFDYKNAVDLDNETDPFKVKVMQHISNFLKGAGVSNAKVAMDNNGIVRWSGQHYVNKQLHSITGDIGQIFTPNNHGIISTHFGSNKNYDLVPGISGYFIYDNIEKPRMERLRGKSYEQILFKKINSSLVDQLTHGSVDYQGTDLVTQATDSTRLNKIYHGDMYATRVPSGWFDTCQLDQDTKIRIIKTLSGRVRFDNKLGEYATTFLENSNTNNNGNSISVDRTVSALVDNKNMRVLDDDLIGTFDMSMTATNKSQGLVWYMAEGAKLNSDGTFSASPMTNSKYQIARAPLRNSDLFKYSDNDAWDRQQMSANQLLTALKVDNKTNLMLGTFGGFTFDDSAVVSKEYAERNSVVNEKGVVRPLRVGDKIADIHGNKATIGLIVDRSMSSDAAKQQELEKEVKIFKSNPNLDVVMSPYSVITRDNAGLIHELQADKSHIKNVYDGDGNKIGQMGKVNTIITNMLVDSKTHAYTPEDVRNGKGRKFSSQLTWALNEMNAKGVITEAFSKNDRAWSDLREYYVATGLDLKENGQLHIGYDSSQTQEFRKVFDVEQMVNNPDVNVDSDSFIKQLGNHGGILKLPAKIKLASGVETNELPILSASLRRNTELLTSNVRVNDYTEDYGQIFSKAKELCMPENKNNQQKVIQLKKELQNNVNVLQNKIVNNQLGGYFGETSKHSFMKDHIMSRRMPYSATAVWTADPRLPIDKIGISPDIAKSLNLKSQDEYITIFRDPVLHAGSVRGVQAKVENHLTGMSINPIMDKSFDGDFDGDSIGLVSFKTKEAQKDMRDKMSIKNNLADKNSNGKSIYINCSMDLVSGARAAGIVQKYNPNDTNSKSPKEQLNGLFKDIIVNSQDPDEALLRANSLVKKALRSNNYGSAHIELSNEDAMYKSINSIVADGAKGSNQSIDEFKAYFDGKKGIKDAQEIQRASGIKSDETGNAGSKSQQLMALLRNHNPEAALELTYPITQATVQIKHDAQQGDIVHQDLSQDLQNLYQGYDRHDFDHKYHLPKNQWKEQMRQVYNNDFKVDLNDDYLEDVCDDLSGGKPYVQGTSALMKDLASPMDQIAYGGGFNKTKKLAAAEANLTDGKWSRLIAPKSMTDSQTNKKLYKQDVQDKDLINSISQALNYSLSDEKMNSLVNAPASDNSFGMEL